MRCQHDIDGYKRHLLHELGQYQSDQHYDQVQRLILAMIELSKFEAHLLQSLQKCFYHGLSKNTSNFDADMDSVNKCLQLFIYQCTATAEKNQFFNPTPIEQHCDY